MTRTACVLRLATAAGLLLASCAKPPEIEPQYAPAASVVEVVAVLQRHVPDDTYRFEPARDFTGRNVYRSALLRLESIETAYEPALRAGHLDDVIAFSKGRALERLRGFELAAANYRRAAERDGELRAEALRSAALCDALAEAAHTGFDADADVAADASPSNPGVSAIGAGRAPTAAAASAPSPAASGTPSSTGKRPPSVASKGRASAATTHPPSSEATHPPSPAAASPPSSAAKSSPSSAASRAPSATAEAPLDASSVIAASDRRVALLEAIRGDAQGTHYAAIAREEIERADIARAEFFVASRRLSPDGDVRAVTELQRVIERHRDSRSANRHLISLGDLYGDLAREYVVRHPAESLLFDPASFQELVDSASRLYEAVGRQDGTPERLEASQRLEGLLAFTLRVDGDRFTP